MSNQRDDLVAKLESLKNDNKTTEQILLEETGIENFSDTHTPEQVESVIKSYHETGRIAIMALEAILNGTIGEESVREEIYKEMISAYMSPFQKEKIRNCMEHSRTISDGRVKKIVNFVNLMSKSDNGKRIDIYLSRKYQDILNYISIPRAISFKIDCHDHILNSHNHCAGRKQHFNHYFEGTMKDIVTNVIWRKKVGRHNRPDLNRHLRIRIHRMKELKTIRENLEGHLKIKIDKMKLIENSGKDGYKEGVFYYGRQNCGRQYLKN